WNLRTTPASTTGSGAGGRRSGRSSRVHGGWSPAGQHLAVRQVDPTIAGVLRMHGDVEVSAVLLHVRLGSSYHGIGKLALVVNTDIAIAFGHEQPAVGQEGQAERRFEVARQDFDFELLLL